jgi:pyruvate dehydrogenase E1 component alpha subunit
MQDKIGKVKTLANVRDFDRDTVLEMLRKMLLIRRFEEKAGQMYGLRKIGGFLHLYIGQEAVAVGAIQALDLKKDYVLTAYRDHGHAFAVGMDAKSLMAELYAKKTGCAKGKGGSMHFFDVSKNFYGGNGIVGAHIPIATGFGVKIRYKNEDGVVLCFFGDGAIHQGSFHESLNMAKIWDLPVIYIVENNQYGMGTFYERVSSVNNFAQLGCAYDIPGRQLNGMDVIEMYDGISKAVEIVRKDHHPYLIEAKTYRYVGHSMSDPAKYRTKEELLEYKNQDSIIWVKDAMLRDKLITEDEYEKLDQELKNIVKEAVDFADKSEEPELEALYEDIYV